MKNNTENEPLVSVVIPCYNQGQYIEEAVVSVLSQTYQNFEIIIVNDGSSDEETNKILSTFKRPKTKVIQTTNQGLSAARNNGIKISKGKYILPLDADDKIGSTYIEKAVEKIETNPRLGIVYCEAEFFGAVQGHWNLPEFSLRHFLITNTIFCTALFRKSDWEKVGGYNETMKEGLEDYDFWLSLIEQGYEVYRIPEVLFYYRKKAVSMHSAFFNEKFRLKMYEKIIGNHPDIYKKNIVPIVDYSNTMLGEYQQVLLDKNSLEKRNQELNDELERHKILLEKNADILKQIEQSTGWKLLTKYHQFARKVFHH